METLLDFSRELDVTALDQLVDLFYSGQGTESERKQADQVLNQLRDHPDSWVRAGSILQKSTNANSKFLALATLDKMIKSRWKTLTMEERTGIRNFVGAMCLEWAATPDIFENQRQLLNKADLTLVEILKQDWPQNWPSFIPDIAQTSRAGLEVCENNMTILRLLSEEVFDYSTDGMTQAKARALKTQLSNEFEEIFKLCHEVLKMADRPSLVIATLKCLKGYLSWIPLAFVFETDIIELLVTKLLKPHQYRNVTLKCLTEIAGLHTDQYSHQLVQMFAAAVSALSEIISPDQDLKKMYTEVNAQDQDFIQNYSLFLSIFLSSHLRLVEQADQSLLMQVHAILLQISKVEEREIFKGCLEYWSRLVLQLFDEIKAVPNIQPSCGAVSPAVLAQHTNLRKHQYSQVLSQLRVIMIEHMVRPEEVLISENEDGEIVRVAFKENDTLTLYKSLRDVLVYLTHLDVEDTEAIMNDKLERQVDGSEWSWHRINTLCWAIGSISGTMSVTTEKHFLVHVIKRLLKLTEKRSTKGSKAVVASNIMYIVGQYPRFLRARVHWTFFKAVVNKLFEFMHESHEGVQDMACDTFMKIATKCKSQFLETPADEEAPFIEQIIANIQKHTDDLEPHQVQSFYESCGHILSAQHNKDMQSRLLEELMRFPNTVWQHLIGEISSSPNNLPDSENVKILVNVIKTNTAVCGSLGAPFETQLSCMFNDMIGLYDMLSKLVLSNAYSDPQFTLTHVCRTLRAAKREILKLMEAYISVSENKELVATQIAPALVSTILEDYRQVPPQLREYEVLKCVTVIVEGVAQYTQDMVLPIFANVFECTLSMLSEDLTEYPEFRVSFFKLLRAINKHCFSALLQLPPEIFNQTLNACLWAAKHDNRDVEDVGLSLTLEIVVNVLKLENTELIGKFFKHFTKLIIGDTFTVLTDPDHKSGFALQSEIFLVFIEAVEREKIPVPLYDEGEAPAGTSNAQYLKEYLSRSLKAAFPYLLEQKLQIFVVGLFSLLNNRQAFRAHLRDFLIQIREMGGDETDYLYAEERSRELETAKREQYQRDAQVPGLLKPDDIEDEDD